jgi:hypothetical protein
MPKLREKSVKQSDSLISVPKTHDAGQGSNATTHEFASQMELADKIMSEDRGLLRSLADVTR